MDLDDTITDEDITVSEAILSAVLLKKPRLDFGLALPFTPTPIRSTLFSGSGLAGQSANLKSPVTLSGPCWMRVV